MAAVRIKDVFTDAAHHKVIITVCHPVHKAMIFICNTFVSFHLLNSSLCVTLICPDRLEVSVWVG